MARLTVGQRAVSVVEALRMAREEGATYRGVWSWITTVDHKRIGVLYGVSAFAFFPLMVPLMIGARDVAFPRLNAFSYWVFLFGALFMNASFIAGGAPDVGWFGYANLTSSAFSLGHGVGYWLLGLLILGGAPPGFR